MKNKHRPITQSNAAFATADISKVQRSTFLRPSSLKTTFNCGKLVPIYVDEVLPGDTFKMDMQFLARLSTPLNPTMDDINLEFYAFFVPNRLVWAEWVNLMGENTSGAWTPSEPPALVPYMTLSNYLSSNRYVKSGKLGDYYGLPVGMDYVKQPGVDDFNPVSVLPFRGYALIWNEWFRDENLQAPIVWDNGNSGFFDATSAYGVNADLLPVNKFHDYFTSALPAPLKGDSPLIPIELNKLIPVITADVNNKALRVARNSPTVLLGTNGDAFTDYVPGTSSGAVLIGANGQSSAGSEGKQLTAQPSVASISGSGYSGGIFFDNLVADPTGIGNLSGSTISQLRTLFQIQKLLERDARGGTRYRELLLSHFGVDAGDYRLHRPEFLGKYVQRLGMQSVPQTSASVDGQTPQGNLAAYSLSVGSSHIIDKSFVEHGFIHIFAVARQVKTYQQGLEKFWSRRDRYDFYWNELSHISEQPVYNKEIYAIGDNADADNRAYFNGVFGYQEAWADYRYKPNHVTGQMRTNSVDSSGNNNSLDIWHYADWYDANNKPYLSDGWIKDNSDTNVDRTLAIPSTVDNQIRMDLSFHCVATRPMPVKSIPGLVDHF